jgi:hypothetical protein
MGRRKSTNWVTIVGDLLDRETLIVQKRKEMGSIVLNKIT